MGVLVVGDILLDQFCDGAPSRLSREGPCPVLEATRHWEQAGGAGRVATLLRLLGEPVWLAGVLGHDEHAETARSLLHDSGVTTWLSPGQQTGPTHRSLRVLAAGQLVVRVSYEQGCLTNDDHLLRGAAYVIENGQASEVVIADYGRGVMTPTVARQLTAMAAEKGLPVFVDCRDTSGVEYPDATVLKVNQWEAVSMLRRNGAVHPGLYAATEEDRLLAAARLLFAAGRHAVVLVTGGVAGCAYATSDATELVRSYRLPVYNTCGAGDAVMAGLVAGWREGHPLSRAVDFAMAVAGVAIGTSTPPGTLREQAADAVRAREGVVGKLTSVEGLQRRWRHEASRGRIVLANGCFDGLHAGHVQLLTEAKALGGLLVVAINDDASLRSLKGEGRPLVPLADRQRHLAAITAVDFVVVFDGDTEALVRAIRPDVLVKGEDARQAYPQLPGADFVAAHGGRVEYLPTVRNFSSRLFETVSAESGADYNSAAPLSQPAPADRCDTPVAAVK